MSFCRRELRSSIRVINFFTHYQRAVLAVLLGALGAWETAQAALPANRARLPDLDVRKGEFANVAYANPEQRAAVNQLLGSASGVKLQRHAVLGTPQRIRSAAGFLTPPVAALAAGDPDQPVRNFLNTYAALFGEGDTVLATAAVTRDSTSAAGGIRSKIWEQRLDGLPVFEAKLVANTARQGQLISISSRMVPQLAQVANAAVPNHAVLAAAPPMTGPNAVVLAAQNIGVTVATQGLTEKGPKNGWRLFNAAELAGDAIARLVWLPLGPTRLALCWEVWVTDRSKGQQYQVLVDAQTSQVLLRRFQTRYAAVDATYNVFTLESPAPMLPGCPDPCSTQAPTVSRQLITTPALDLNASPNGWINETENFTAGNNVIASTDTNGDEVPDLPYTTGTVFRVFDYPLDLNLPAESYTKAAVVQFFYYLNKGHDIMWLAGFDEAAGNFQQDNFGRGGFGGDPVFANAQSPNAENNAYARPAPDGISPTLNMGLFTSLSPSRDSDLDQMVALHELFHAVSDRLNGGILYFDGYQSGAMQEGWSDFAGLVLNVPAGTDPDGVYPEGAYLTYQLVPGFDSNYYFGIRRYPYTTDLTKNPLTYKDIDDAQASSHPGVPISPVGWEAAGASEVHNAGEVWCAVLWELRAALAKRYGDVEGNDRSLRLVIEGLKLLNTGNYTPSFLDARDAILDANRADYNGDDVNLIWAAFAKRGMGFSAQSPSDGSNDGVVEAFDQPGLAYVSSYVTGGNGNGVIDPSECSQLSIILSNITDQVIQGELSGTLVSKTLGVIVDTATQSYPTVPVGGSVTNLVPFDISTSPGFACGTTIDFVLTVKTGGGFSTFDIPVATVSGSVGPTIRFDQYTPMEIPDLQTVESTVDVSGVSGALQALSLDFHISHTFDGDLNISLISPDNTVVPIVIRRGGGGDNFGTNCVNDATRAGFASYAVTNVADGVPPFVGVYLPDGDLLQFNGKTGAALNGTWRLRISDEQLLDAGTLNCWSLFIISSVCTNGSGPCRPSPLLCVEPSLVFQPQGVGTTSDSQTLHVQNCGAETLYITNAVIAGANAADFAIVGNSCGGTLGVGESCELQVAFSPVALPIPPLYPQSREAVLQFNDNAPDSPQSVALSGTAVLCDAIVLGPAVLTNPVLGVAYSAQVEVTGATAPITFFRTAGDYPPGLTMDAAGLISGTPIANGVYSFKVKILDAVGCQAEKYFTLRVGCPVIGSLPAALPLGQVGNFYSQQLTGIGGVAPYTFTQVGGSLPVGMTLASNGVLSGTPTSGSSVFVVQVVDAGGCAGSVTYTIELANPPPYVLVGPPSLAEAAVSAAYNQTLTATGGSGAHTFNVVSGSLPAGLSLSSAGVLSGTPTKTGTASFVIRATDASGAVGSRAYALPVKAGVTDLGVAIVIANAGAVVEGDAVVYLIQVRNLGAQPAANVQLSGSLASASLGTIAAGATASVEVSVPTIAAGTVTASASVTCDLADSNPANNSLTVQTAVAARPQSLVQLNASSLAVGVGAGQVVLVVTRAGNTSVPASCGYYTVDGSATAGVDYTGASSVVNFAAGETTKVIMVPLLTAKATGTRSFQVRLNSPGAGVAFGTRTQATITIQYGAAANVVSVADADGDRATVELVGAGSLAATFNTDGSLGDLRLTGTTEASSLLVTVQRGVAGDGAVPLGRVEVSGSLKTISLANAGLRNTSISLSGSLGSLRAAKMTGSSLVTGGNIASVRLNAFGSSSIIGAQLGRIALGAVNTVNGGQAFGVQSQGVIGSVTVKSPAFKWNKAGAADQAIGDFHVRH